MEPGFLTAQTRLRRSEKELLVKKIILVALAFFIGGAVIPVPSLQTQTLPPIFEGPILITSAGQSAEVQLAAVLCKKAELDAVLVKAAEAKDLAGRKTLLLVLGASMKGLGAAGLDVEKEKGRVKALLAEAKAKGIPVLAMHLGGESRRGELTDAMAAEYLPSARLVIVVKSGNKDGLFTKICKDNGLVLQEVDKTLDAVGPLKSAFKK